ncbi:PD-(D/E)XK motif protein [Arthrobacter sp. MDT2-2]
MASLAISSWILTESALTDIAATSEFILDAFEVLGYRALPAGSLDAKRVPGRRGTYIAVSESRELFLLLEVGSSTSVEERRFKSIRVLSGDGFSIVDTETGEAVERRFAMVALRPNNADLASSFATVTATLLATLADTPSAADVVQFLDGLVALVAPRQLASASVVTGLWGELWMIASAVEPAVLAAAWHGSSADRFDFSLPHSRIEVKTTAGRGRIHEFNLDQLDYSGEKPTWIASITVTSDSSGDTVMDLLEKLIDKLPRTLAARVHRIALETVAGDIESVQDFAFAPIGVEPLLLFDSRSIPRVSVPHGAGISGVRFRADLDRLVPAGASDPIPSSLKFVR